MIQSMPAIVNGSPPGNILCSERCFGDSARSSVTDLSFIKILIHEEGTNSAFPVDIVCVPTVGLK